MPCCYPSSTTPNYPCGEVKRHTFLAMSHFRISFNSIAFGWLLCHFFAIFILGSPRIKTLFPHHLPSLLHHAQDPSSGTPKGSSFHNDPHMESCWRLGQPERLSTSLPTAFRFFPFQSKLQLSLVILSIYNGATKPSSVPSSVREHWNALPLILDPFLCRCKHRTLRRPVLYEARVPYSVSGYMDHCEELSGPFAGGVRQKLPRTESRFHERRAPQATFTSRFCEKFHLMLRC